MHGSGDTPLLRPGPLPSFLGRLREFLVASSSNFGRGTGQAASDVDEEAAHVNPT